jgi:hypothetical protein
VDVRTNEQAELSDPLWIGIIIGVYDKNDRNRVIAFQVFFGNFLKFLT